ncbi:coiled-coil domain-containing protein 153 isoform X1 [Osmerus eperlanus]|uniref:coiled-coil domain-containing protein 153 isoform X1 n=1 Tax=Osmerus eperlanus TaxID=29151 RepID=UPI002E10B1D2
MPPKKKGRRKIKKTKKPEEGVNKLEAQYKRTVLDVEILRDHLAVRCDAARQARVVSSELRVEVRDLEQKLSHERQDRSDVSAGLVNRSQFLCSLPPPTSYVTFHQTRGRFTPSDDMVSRQYDSIQTGLTARVKRLEEEVISLRQQLAQCKEELRTERAQGDLLQQEKDATISELQTRLDSMETDYEKILHDSLDSLASQLCAARQGWEDQSFSLHQEYKVMLSDFGLNSLDI